MLFSIFEFQAFFPYHEHGAWPIPETSMCEAPKPAQKISRLPGIFPRYFALGIRSPSSYTHASLLHSILRIGVQILLEHVN